VYIGLRTRLGGQFTLGPTACLASAKAVAQSIESRVIDCLATSPTAMPRPVHVGGVYFRGFPTPPNYHILKEGETPPPAPMWAHSRGEETVMLDRKPSIGPQTAVVRLGDPGTPVTCAQVRAAQFPAFHDAFLRADFELSESPAVRVQTRLSACSCWCSSCRQYAGAIASLLTQAASSIRVREHRAWREQVPSLHALMIRWCF